MMNPTGIGGVLFCTIFPNLVKYSAITHETNTAFAPSYFSTGFRHWCNSDFFNSPISLIFF